METYLGHGEKVLVVDDEARQRVIACGILTKLGYMAEAVSSGERTDFFPFEAERHTPESSTFMISAKPGETSRNELL